jgi:hypothetical protein
MQALIKPSQIAFQFCHCLSHRDDDDIVVGRGLFGMELRHRQDPSHRHSNSLWLEKAPGEAAFSICFGTL